jgi:hypothetical protein
VYGQDLGPRTRQPHVRQPERGGFPLHRHDDRHRVPDGNPVAATPLGTTLALANATVVLDPGSYGSSTEVVIPGLQSRVDTGSFIGGSSFAFRAEGDGTVTSLSPASIDGVGTSVVFRNATIVNEPQAYTGNDTSTLTSFTQVTGRTTLVAIPGQTYSLVLGAATGGSGFPFAVAADGTVSTTSAAASGDGAVLGLANRTVTFDATTFTGAWLLSSHLGLGYLPGSRTVVLVSGIRYRAVFGGLSGMDFTVEVGASAASVPTAYVAAVSAWTITFNTEVLRVTPSTQTLSRVGVRPYATGEQSFALIPNLRWSTDTGSITQIFTLTSPRAVSPPSLAVGTTTLPLSCAPTDADGDGVPDAVDVCPGVPDPARLDFDGDGLGDACDPDLDGDGIPNATDVRPDVLHDPRDLDGDGVGDACDADADGDLVSDGSDNCVGMTNADRVDTDGGQASKTPAIRISTPTACPTRPTTACSSPTRRRPTRTTMTRAMPATATTTVMA